jgi:glucan phosphoethanolaminetransferase (alkaline phosphatase superfamily)
MKPIYLAALILLALTLGLALLGMVLISVNKIHARNAARYTQLCTILILGAAYAMTQTSWPGIQLRPLDFWSLMVILTIVAYSLVWAAIAYRLNTVSARGDFGESYMLSMLHTDSNLPPEDGFSPTKVIDRKAR